MGDVFIVFSMSFFAAFVFKRMAVPSYEIRQLKDQMERIADAIERMEKHG